jgi:Integrase core domain
MVQRCTSYAALRLKRGPKRTYSLTVFPPDRPFEFIFLYMLGTLPKTSRGNQYVLCICDRFSKISIAVAMPDQTASTVARELVDRWIAPFGVPITILSDNGPCFASTFFQVFNNVLGVKHVFTSAYRPTTNGQVERWNASLVDMLTHLTREKDWDRSLGLACVTHLFIRRPVMLRSSCQLLENQHLAYGHADPHCCHGANQRNFSIDRHCLHELPS